MNVTVGPKAVALIPARAGSKRLPDKNVRLLANHPLMAYTIAAARASNVFHDIVVSTDSPAYADVARHYGAGVPFLRPPALSGDQSPDIEWVAFTLERLAAEHRRYDCFSILRPTSPFRLPQTIRRAWEAFVAEDGVDSLRAVERCRQHPGKMWVLRERRLLPLLPFSVNGRPWHSNQYQALPEVFVQNASLEIAWTRIVERGSIAGEAVMPFFTEGYEGFDVNSPLDWLLAEDLVRRRAATLPEVPQSPFASA